MEDGKVLDGGFPSDLSAYLNVDLPDWQTPELWCTKKGWDIMKDTGKFLLSSPLSPLFSDDDLDQNSNGNMKKKLHVQFITDSVSRDVSTSFALAEGLAQGASESIAPLSVHGLEKLEYDPILFHPTRPWDINDVRDSIMNEVTATCRSSSASPEELSQEIEAQLDAFPYPAGVSLRSALNIIENHAGIGSAGSLLDFYSDDEESSLDTNFKGDQVLGLVNIVTLVAQMVFYSRASNKTFLPSMSTEETMQLVAWLDWSQMIRHGNTKKSALVGSVLAHRILELLEESSVAEGSLPPIKPDVDEEITDYVTFIVGHDSDLLTVATALNMSWSFPEPYYSVDGQSATAPGSALYFRHSHEDKSGNDPQSSRLDIQMMAPMFDFFEPPEGEPVTPSGTLYSVPVQFGSWNGANPEDATTPAELPTVGDSFTQIVAQDPLHDLRAHMEATLSTYDGDGYEVMSCYANAMDHYSSRPANHDDVPTTPTITGKDDPLPWEPVSGEDSNSGWSGDAHLIGLVLGASWLCIILVVVARCNPDCLRRRRRRRNHHSRSLRVNYCDEETADGSHKSPFSATIAPEEMMDIGASHFFPE